VRRVIPLRLRGVCLRRERVGLLLLLLAALDGYAGLRVLESTVAQANIASTDPRLEMFAATPTARPLLAVTFI
jgi:hypothetical protein